MKLTQVGPQHSYPTVIKSRMSKSSSSVPHAVAIDDVHIQVQGYAAEPTAPANPNYVPAGTLPQFQNEGGAREYLQGQGFPQGLQDSFIETLGKIPLRFFILDDSGSMAMNDGKRIVVSSGKKAMISCSRWTELTEALKFHVNFARQASAPSEFRLLNGAPPIRIGMNDSEEGNRLAALNVILEGSPSGGTPLCRHIREVTVQIRAAEQELRTNGQKACVIIATDGESSDGNIAEAMAPLKDLPVWVVVRLCTDEEKIVNYWNNIDEQLELSMDVLDDLSGEASEVHEKNPWLTYGEPIQRLREFGIAIKELDLLDEAPLSKEQARLYARIIFGGKLDEYPHPELDFARFAQFVEKKNLAAGEVWDPVDKRNKHWIDKRKLQSTYGPKGCTIS